MLEFYKTRAGRTYFEATLPRLIKAIERLADALEEKEEKEEYNEGEEVNR